MLFYLLRRKERSNSSRDQVLSTECRCCPTLSGDGLKLLYSNLCAHWLTRRGVPSFDWPQGVFSGRVRFLKGKNEHHTTLETRDRATAAAARPTLSPSTCSQSLGSSLQDGTVGSRREQKHTHSLDYSCMIWGQKSILQSFLTDIMIVM